MSGSKLRDAVRQMAGTHNKTYGQSVVCSVSEVDINSRTCTCVPLGGKTTSDLTGVQLMAEVDDGWLLEPVIDSTVIVSVGERGLPYVALYSEIQNAWLIVAGKIQFQGGEFGGLVKVIQLTAKLNKLESDLNTLKTAFSSWVPVIDDGGAALKAAAADWSGSAITKTIRTDIENTHINHGT